MSRQDRPAAAARPHRPVTPLLDQSWEVAQRSSGQWTCRSYLLDILSTAHTICVLIFEVEAINDAFAYFLSQIKVSVHHVSHHALISSLSTARQKAGRKVKGKQQLGSRD